MNFCLVDQPNSGDNQVYTEVCVLIVEDDPLVSRMIRRMLEQIGYTIAGRAVDGRQAVEMTQSLRPDVVLIDIEIPDMDGLEAALRIHHGRCPTPVVVLTAYETLALVEVSQRGGRERLFG